MRAIVSSESASDGVADHGVLRAAAGCLRAPEMTKNCEPAVPGASACGLGHREVADRVDVVGGRGLRDA